jgi:hypothetical protein
MEAIFMRLMVIPMPGWMEANANLDIPIGADPYIGLPLLIMIVVVILLIILSSRRLRKIKKNQSRKDRS